MMIIGLCSCSSEHTRVEEINVMKCISKQWERNTNIGQLNSMQWIIVNRNLVAIITKIQCLFLIWSASSLWQTDIEIEKNRPHIGRCRAFCTLSWDYRVIFHFLFVGLHSTLYHIYTHCDTHNNVITMCTVHVDWSVSKISIFAFYRFAFSCQLQKWQNCTVQQWKTQEATERDIMKWNKDCKSIRCYVEPVISVNQM